MNWGLSSLSHEKSPSALTMTKATERKTEMRFLTSTISTVCDLSLTCYFPLPLLDRKEIGLFYSYLRYRTHHKHSGFFSFASIVFIAVLLGLNW